ncbi:MAG TPA: hypothetical protein VHS32_04715, partial [Streptosporangiaceae bacterium]|nr:hypothetical protein [Streptosporangiaceae bacterium]
MPDVIPASQASSVSRSRRHGAAYLLVPRCSPGCGAGLETSPAAVYQRPRNSFIAETWAWSLVKAS